MIRKRMFSIFLVFTMLLGLFPASVWAEGDEAETTVAVSSASATVNEEVTLDVTLTPAVGFTGLGMGFDYDKEAITFKEFIVSREVIADDEVITKYYMGTKPTMGDGIISLASDAAVKLDSKNPNLLFKVVFQVNQNAYNGTYEIKIIGNEEGKDPVLSYSGTSNVNADYVSGYITVTGGKDPVVSGIKLTQGETETSVVQVTGEGDAKIINATAYSDAEKTKVFPNAVTWNVTPTDSGVSIDANGAITVEATAAAVTYTVTANGDADTAATFTVEHTGQYPAKVELTIAPTEIEVTGSGNDQTVTSTAKVLDQFNEDYTYAGTISYSLEDTEDTQNVSVNESGVITIKQQAKEDEGITVKASINDGGKEGNAELEATATLKINQSDSSKTTVTELNIVWADGAVTEVELPTTGSATIQAEVSSASNIYGDTVSNPTVTWKVRQNDTEITETSKISVSSDGLVTITSDAKDGLVPSEQPVSFTLEAAAGTDTKTLTFTVKRAAASFDSWKVWKQVGTNDEVLFDLAKDSIIIPAAAATTNSYTYRAVAYDQYGKEFGAPSISITRPAGDEDANVTIDGGTITLAAGAAKNLAYTLTASVENGTDKVITLTTTDLLVTWPTVTVTDANLVYGKTLSEMLTFDKANASASLDGVAQTGDFKLYLDGEEVTDDAWTSLPTKGEHSYYANFSNDTYNVNCEDSSASGSFTVAQAENELTVSGEKLEGTTLNLTYGDEITITVKGSALNVNDVMHEIESSNVTVTKTVVDAENKEFQLSITADHASDSDITLTLTQAEDSNVAGASTTVTIKVAKADKELKFDPATLDLTYGDSVTMSLEGGDENTTLVSDSPNALSVTGSGVSYTLNAAQAAQGITLTATRPATDDVNEAVAKIENLTIAQKPIEATSTLTMTKDYDGTTDAGEVAGDITVSGALSTDTDVKIDTKADSIVKALVYASKDAGESTITLSKADLQSALVGENKDNYTLTTESVTAAATIKPIARSIEAVTPETALLTADQKTAALTVTPEKGDDTPVIAYKSDKTDVVSVNSNGQLEALANGEATISVNLEATTNYLASEAKTVSVTVVLNPLADVTVEDTNLTVSLDKENKAIKVSGNADPDTVKITPVLDEALKNDLTAQESEDGKTLTISYKDQVVATYTINKDDVVDLSEVDAEIADVEKTDIEISAEDEEKLGNEDVTIVDEETGNEITVSKDVAEGAETPEEAKEIAKEAADAIASKDSTISDLVSSVAKALENIAKSLETLIASLKADAPEGAPEPEVTIKVGVSIEAKSLVLPKAATEDKPAVAASFKFEIEPTYQAYSKTTTGEGEAQTTEETKLEGEGTSGKLGNQLSNPVPVSMKLPNGFPTENLYARHKKSSGRFERIPVTVKNGIASWMQSSFSEVELYQETNESEITVDFVYTGEGKTVTQTLTIADIENFQLPKDTIDGIETSTWKTADETLYTGVLTEALYQKAEGESGAKKLTLTSVPDAGDVTVNFYNGETLQETKTYKVTNINNVTLPTAEQENAVFEGWNIGKSGTEKFSGLLNSEIFNAALQNNMTLDLYASFKDQEQAPQEEENTNTNSGSSGGGSSSTPASNVKTGTDGDVTADLTPKTDKDGAVTATPSTSQVNALVSQAAKAEGDVVLSVDKLSDDATKLTVDIPNKLADGVGQTDADLVVDSGLATVEIPNEALSALSEGGKDLALTVEKNEDGSVTVDLTAGGESVSEVPGGLKTTLPVAEEDQTPGLVAVIVKEDGTEEVLPFSALTEDGTLAVQLPGSATLKLENRSKLSSFTDADQIPDWAKPYVDFVTARGIFNGNANGTFAPTAQMSRGMLVTALHNMVAKDVNDAPNVFTDVKGNEWFANSVNWAYRLGIVSGRTKNSFAPDADITRQETAVILYNYAKSAGMDLSGEPDMTQHPDADKVADWAQPAIKWCVANGIFAGDENKYLNPEDNTTRAEMAAILYNFVTLTLS